VSRAEQRYRRIHGRLDDRPDGSSIFDCERGQFAQTTQQDHGERRSQWRQISTPKARAGTQIDQQAGQQLQPAALDGASGVTE
jgi:hypothetical protein